jgi:hypothetical protein
MGSREKRNLTALAWRASLSTIRLATPELFALTVLGKSRRAFVGCSCFLCSELHDDGESDEMQLRRMFTKERNVT